MFTSVDKAGQFAGGYVYCGNNPIYMVDPDGQFAWFLLIGAVVGAYSGYEYAEATGADPFTSILAGAAIGMVSGAAGAAVADATAVGAAAVGSAVNSTCWYAASGGKTGLGISLGFGNYDLLGGTWTWADFQGNLLSDVSTVMGYVGLTEDLSKLEYELFEPKETKALNEAVQAKFDVTSPNPNDHWTYIPGKGLVENLPTDNQNWLFPWQDYFSSKGGDNGSAHFRTRMFHFVKKAGKITIHKNQFPATGLFGFLNIPHILLEGRISDLPFVQPGAASNWTGAASNWIDKARWRSLAVGTGMYKSGVQYYGGFYW